jgi:hypothetical protein
VTDDVKTLTVTFEEIAATAKQAKPYDGVLLRYQNSQAVAICDHCEVLRPTWGYGWTSDWLTLAGQARDHVASHPGHRVGVSMRHDALYAGEDVPDE